MRKEIKSCPICGAHSNHAKGKVEGFVKNLFFDIVECISCKSSFASPLEVNPQIYNAIYKQANRIPGYSRYSSLPVKILDAKSPAVLMENLEDCYYGILRELKKLPKNKDFTIVEVGCGLGYLTHTINSLGYRCIGVDISKASIAHAKKTFSSSEFFCGTIEEFIQDNDKPTIIVSTEVIEHLVDPAAFIKLLLTPLKKASGVKPRAIISTPYKHESTKSLWEGDLPPIHLFWFTKESFRRMALVNNSTVKFIDLSKFYEEHPTYIKYPNIPGIINRPFLDKNYQYYDEGAIKNIFRTIGNFSFKRKVSKYLKEKALRTNETSHSICAVFYPSFAKK